MPASPQRTGQEPDLPLPYGEASDFALLQAGARGDSAAFSEILNRYLKNMLALAQRFSGNTADADEVVQEAFLRLWVHAPRWNAEGGATLKTWLSRVVMNLCIDRYRLKKPIALDDAGELVDPAASSFEAMQLADRRRMVQHLLLGLPDRQRIAISLAYLDEMSVNDVAKTMDLTAGAVESLLVRARRSLRKRLNDLGLMREGDL